MNYTITEVFLDMAEKYRVRVIIDDTTRETFFFKFDHYPSQEEVNSVVNNYKTALANSQSQENNDASQ